jgi:hypothetical protein
MLKSYPKSLLYMFTLYASLRSEYLHVSLNQNIHKSESFGANV